MKRFTTNLHHIIPALMCMVFAGFALLMPTSIFAQQTYQPLTSIPFVPTGTDVTLAELFNGFFILTIIAGALIAVVKISIAGFKWMMTDSITTKSDAKADITGALLGLAILLSTYVVLYQINKDLVNLDVLREARERPAPIPSGSASAPVSATSGSTIIDTVAVTAEKPQAVAVAEAQAAATNSDAAKDCIAKGATPRIEPVRNGPMIIRNDVVCPAITPSKKSVGFLTDNAATAAKVTAAATSCTAAGGSASTGTQGVLTIVDCNYNVIPQKFEREAQAQVAVQNCTNAGGAATVEDAGFFTSGYTANCTLLSSTWPPEN